ncbi:MAG: hypothetical protein Q8M94_21855 [Ignavibacteria bacterium]|nr:hypothetical protein [Ignavibacteria bacterium]
MRNTVEASTITIGKIFLTGSKPYIMPHWESIRDLLQEYHGKTIKRSRTFEVLQILTNAGFFHRKKRYTPRGNGLSTQLSGMLFLTLKFCYYLKSAGFDGWKVLRDRVLLYIKSGDNRYPPAPPDSGQGDGTATPTESTKPTDKIPDKIKNLAGSLFKTIKQGVSLCF